MYRMINVFESHVCLKKTCIIPEELENIDRFSYIEDTIIVTESVTKEDI